MIGRNAARLGLALLGLLGFSACDYDFDIRAMLDRSLPGPSPSGSPSPSPSLPAASSNADLASLSLPGAVLDSGFSAADLSYQTTVPQSLDNLFIQASPADAGAALRLRVNNGAWSAFSGNASVPVLEASPSADTLLSLEVTAPDGRSVKLYQTIVHKTASPLSLSPVDIVCPVNTSRNVLLSGGTPPYSFGITQGGGSVSAISGGLSFNAGAVAGDGKILVSDSGGQSGIINFHSRAPYTLIPAQIGVRVSSDVSFEITGGGGGPYTVAVQSGDGMISPSSGTTFTYTQGSGTANGTLSVRDNAGGYHVIDVTVTSQAFGLSPMVIKGGTTVNLQPSGPGTYPYRLYITGGYPTGTTLNAGTPVDGGWISAPASLYLPPQATGSTIYIRIDDQVDGNAYDVPVQLVP